jgi:hypothetical protein
MLFTWIKIGAATIKHEGFENDWLNNPLKGRSETPPMISALRGGVMN